MASFCIFGAHDGHLSPSSGFHVTIFGAASLRRPPIGQSMLERHRTDAEEPQRSRFVALTVFGATEVTWPTLAQEFIALRQALNTDGLSLDDWDRLTVVPDSTGPLHVHSLTLFGAFDADGLPSENAELDDLSMQRHLGQIPEESVELLMRAVGQSGPPRLAAIRQAVVAALAVRP